MAGNSLKAGVRFFSYDKFKKMLVDRDVSVVLWLGSALTVFSEPSLVADTLFTFASPSMRPVLATLLYHVIHTSLARPSLPPRSPHSPAPLPT